MTKNNLISESEDLLLFAFISELSKKLNINKHNIKHNYNNTNMYSKLPCDDANIILIDQFKLYFIKTNKL